MGTTEREASVLALVGRGVLEGPASEELRALSLGMLTLVVLFVRQAVIPRIEGNVMLLGTAPAQCQSKASVPAR